MAKYVLSAFADEVTPVFADQIAYAKKQGFKYLELRNMDGTNISSITLEQARDYKKMLDEAGLGVSSIGSPIGKIDITEDRTEHFKLFLHTLELAEIFETKNIRMFSYFYPEGTDPHDYRDKILENIGKMLDEADKRGINLCHENEARIYGEAPEDCADLMNHFGGRLKCVLDMGNFAFCNRDPMKGYELLKDYIVYIHIKDSHYDSTIVPAGTGDGRIADILALYDKENDGEVILTLEPHLTVFSGLDKLSNMDDIKVTNTYATPEDAFDAGTAALRKILNAIGQ